MKPLGLGVYQKWKREITWPPVGESALMNMEESSRKEHGRNQEDEEEDDEWSEEHQEENDEEEEQEVEAKPIRKQPAPLGPDAGKVLVVQPDKIEKARASQVLKKRGDYVFPEIKMLNEPSANSRAEPEDFRKRAARCRRPR